MGDQQRFGRPPTTVVAVHCMRGRGGRWGMSVTSRLEGESTWDRFDLDDVGVVDLLEAIRTELERRLL